MDLEHRHRKIIEFVDTYGSITNSNAQSITGAHRNTISSDLRILVDKNILRSSGQGKGTIYSLVENLMFSDEVIEPIFNRKDKRALNTYLHNPNRKKVFFHSTMGKAIKADFSYSDEVNKTIEIMRTKIQEKRQLLSEIERKRRKERLVIDLSWASANIEGNTYSILETETLIKYNETSKGKSIEEAQMILNHKDAIEYIRASLMHYKKIAKRNIFELHQILIKNLGISTGFRKRMVAISNSSFVPCDNEFQISSFFDDILTKVDNAHSVLEKAVIVNLLMAYLQPFIDGNKRTSRMLGNAVLLSNGLLPVSFVNTPKEDYIKAVICFYEKQDPRYFKQIFLRELNNSFINYIG